MCLCHNDFAQKVCIPKNYEQKLLDVNAVRGRRGGVGVGRGRAWVVREGNTIASTLIKEAHAGTIT